MKQVNINIGLTIDLESSELTLEAITLKGNREDIQTVKLLYSDLLENIVETILNSDM